MSDIEKRARELLAAELGDYEARCLMDGLGGAVTTGEALSAIIAALTPPEGFVLVPVEPTEEMIEAGWDSASDYIGEHRRIDSLGTAWVAMLAARPGVK